MKLLSPLKVGPIELQNRLVSTAHAAFNEFWRPGTDGQRYIAYQERRARGGTGLIITTAQHVHESSNYMMHYVYEKKDLSRKLGELSTRVHRHGTKALSQLFHVGVTGKSDCRPDFQPVWGLSGTISPEGEASHEMTEEEIEQVIQGFVDTSVVVVESGMDGVELHAAHGYLLQQSFSPFANKRTDRWGEPLYLVRTVAERVRKAIGTDKVLGIRLCIEDFLRPEHGGVGHEKLVEIGAELAGTGLFDYMNHSEGAFGVDYARTIGSFRYPLGEFLPLTRALRAGIKGAIPVVGIGKIPTVDLAEQALENGDCDLVGMTRAQISDPDIIAKVKSKQTHRIRLCTGSNQGCIDRVGLFPITCIHNPEVGEEDRFRALDVPIKAAKNVLVIGGGPAGMKAAEIAARRGHKVTLVEASDRLGGQLNHVESFGQASSLLGSVAWVEQELGYLGVKPLTHTTVDVEFVKKHKPDFVVLATGATHTADMGIPNDGSVPVLSILDAAQNQYDGTKIDMKSARVLMADMRATYETALITEHLVKNGAQVTVATPYLHFGANLGFTHLIDYQRLLPTWDIDVKTLQTLAAIADGKVTLAHVFAGTTTTLEVDFVVAGVHPKPNDALFKQLRDIVPVKMVGDAYAPRSALEAFREGDRATRTLM